MQDFSHRVTNAATEEKQWTNIHILSLAFNLSCWILSILLKNNNREISLENNYKIRQKYFLFDSAMVYMTKQFSFPGNLKNIWQRNNIQQNALYETRMNCIKMTIKCICITLCGKLNYKQQVLPSLNSNRTLSALYLLHVYEYSRISMHSHAALIVCNYSFQINLSCACLLLVFATFLHLLPPHSPSVSSLNQFLFTTPLSALSIPCDACRGMVSICPRVVHPFILFQ